MKKKFLWTSLITVVLVCSLLAIASQIAKASFIASRIIDDSIFENSNSMNAAQIDSFLNSFPNSCISTNSGFGAKVPTGYSPSGGFTFGGFGTAGQVIATAAQVYGVNPQVLLTTLQKEQSLVAGGTGYCNNGDENKYAAAVGYGCPDGGTVYNWSGISLYSRNGVEHTTSGSTCVNSAAKAGFSQQVIRGAWLLKFGQQRSLGNINWAVVNGSWDNSDDLDTFYSGPMTQGTLKRCSSCSAAFYDGYITIDGSATHMDTGATAALYWYTPHFHGNQNFVSIFEGWFGPTVGTVLLQASGPTVYLISGSTRYSIPSGEMLSNYHLASTGITPTSDTYIQSLTDGGQLGTLFTVAGDPTVYLADRGTKYGISSAAVCTAWGFDCSTSKQISFGIANGLSSGGVLQPLMNFEGAVYKMQAGVRRPYLSWNAVFSDGFSMNQTTPIQSGYNIGASVGPPIIENNALVQFGSQSTVYFYTNSHYYAVPDGTTFANWFPNHGIYYDRLSQYATAPPSPSGVMSSLFKNSSNITYVVYKGGKVNVTNSVSNWPAPFIASDLDSILASYPLLATDTAASTYRTPNGALYILNGGKRLTIASMNDFSELGYSLNNTINLDEATFSMVPMGLFTIGEGSVFKVVGSSAIYLKGPGQSVYNLLSTAQLGQFQLTREDPVLPVAQLSLYNAPQILSSFVGLDGSPTAQYVVDAKANLWSFGSTQASQWGISSPALTNVSSNSTTKAGLHTTSSSLPQFALYNGTVYYGSGGVKHPIATFASYQQLGGNASNTFNATQDFIDAAPTGSIM